MSGTAALLLQADAVLAAHRNLSLADVGALKRRVAAAHSPLLAAGVGGGGGGGPATAAEVRRRAGAVCVGVPALDAALGGMLPGAVLELTGPLAGAAVRLAAFLARAACRASGADAGELSDACTQGSGAPRPTLWLTCEALQGPRACVCARTALLAGPHTCFVPVRTLADVASAAASVERAAAAGEGSGASAAVAALPRLLVVESFSALARHSGGDADGGGSSGSLPEGLRQHAAVAGAMQALKSAAERAALAVLLLTEAPALSQQQEQPHGHGSGGPGGGAEAAGELGRAFYHSVHTRLRLHPRLAAGGAGVYVLRVVKSAHCPSHAVPIVIHDSDEGAAGDAYRGVREATPAEWAAAAACEPYGENAHEMLDAHDSTGIPAFIYH